MPPVTVFAAPRIHPIPKISITCFRRTCHPSNKFQSRDATQNGDNVAKAGFSRYRGVSAQRWVSMLYFAAYSLFDLDHIYLTTHFVL